ncbi:MAG TPA: glycosyltransferase family 2 protein, partial [Phycisphaerae bacterium]|nr:glycosyltransferase family 2 protein [Phycisphaerae bacterium]
MHTGPGCLEAAEKQDMARVTDLRAPSLPGDAPMIMIAPKHELTPGLSVVVPCYNEEDAVCQTVEQVAQVLAGMNCPTEMIFVDDGSTDRTPALLDELAGRHPRLRVVHNHANCGYGASLKRGISAARYDRIIITDADGTYPNERIPDLYHALDHADMVVGARIGPRVHIPLARRPVKWLLLKYSRWMAKADIQDINSGLRGIWTRHVRAFWSLLPNAFSFTTTITLATHINQLRVEYLPIDYYQRVGKSSIRPLQDTFRFFTLVFRTIMYFRPLQIFGTAALILMFAAGLAAVGVKLWTGLVPDVTVMSL